MKKFLRSFVFLVSILCSLSLFSLTIHAQEKVYSAQELSQFDGQNGHSAYFAYKGKVYDVTKSTLWKLGEHFGVHAGFDLTDKMEGAPHGDEVLEGFPIVGTYQSVENRVQSTEHIAVSPKPNAVTRPWYVAPMRIFGLSVLGWTGILLGIVFVLNFMTCFALPWSKTDLPWTGNRPGPDPLDASGIHMKWTMMHKYFAWATVIIGLIHGVLGFLQVFFKVYL